MKIHKPIHMSIIKHSVAFVLLTLFWGSAPFHIVFASSSDWKVTGTMNNYR